MLHGWTLKTLGWVKEANHKRPHVVWFHLYKISRIGEFIETERRLVLARAWQWGGRKAEWLHEGTRFFPGWWENVLKSWWWLHNSEYAENHWINFFKLHNIFNLTFLRVYRFLNTTAPSTKFHVLNRQVVSPLNKIKRFLRSKATLLTVHLAVDLIV